MDSLLVRPVLEGLEEGGVLSVSTLDETEGEGKDDKRRARFMGA